MAHLGHGGLVGHRHLAAHTVELKLHDAVAVLGQVAQTDVFDDQRLAVLDVDLGGLAQGHAVEEDVAAHAGDVAVLLAVGPVFPVNLGIEAVGEHGLHVDGVVSHELAHLIPDGVKVYRRQQLAGTAGDGLLALEDHLLQVLGEAPGGLAHHALEVADHAVGEGEGLAPLHDVLRREIVLHHENGQIAHHLGGRGHLDDVAQHLVDRLVHLLDRLEVVAQAQALHLGFQVGVLPARHLVTVDIGGGVLDARFKGGIALPHVGPVVGEFLQLVRLQTGVPLLTLEGGDHRIEGGLAGEGGHGVHGAVHNVHPGLGGHEVSGHLVARGVVGVEMDGDADLPFKGGDQLFGGVGLEQAGHILDAQDVRPPLFQLLGHIDIILQGVLVPFRVQNVAGVADGGLADLVLLEDLVHGHFHAGDPVEGVEDAENVNAGAGRLPDEFPDEVVWVVGVAHGVGPPEEHLEGNIGDLFSQLLESVPGGLVEEPIGHIEGSAAPQLQGEAVVEDLGGTRRGVDEIAGTHPGGEERLVGVAHGGVGDEQFFLILHPALEGPGAPFIQQLLEAAALGGLVLVGREAGDIQLAALGGGVVHLDLGDIAQHLVGAVPAVLKLEELRGLVNELGVAPARAEGGMTEDVGHKGNVGLDAADVFLRDGAGGLAAHGVEGPVPCGDLDQQRVIIGGDDGAGVGVAAVQTDAEAAAGAVGGDLAGVGGEVVGRVLGGDAALDGVAVHPQVVLTGQADLGGGEGVALGDEDLGTHQVHAGDHLGDGVFHLDAGVHLDEIVVAVLVHQEFHRTGRHIAHVLGHFDGVGIEPLSGLLGHAEGGGELHHLLIAPLEGAVALAQVDHIAVLVAQDLHLDVLGLHQILFDKDILVAEGFAGFGFDQLELTAHVVYSVAAAHTAAAAAAGRLEDDGEAEGDRLFHRFIGVPEGHVGAGNGGHAAGVGDGLGGELVAHLGQDLGRGADKGDPGVLAGLGEGGIFRQEPVAGMNGVHVAPLGQVDDGVDVQIGAQRAFVFADQISLVGPGAEEREGVLVGVDGHGVQAQVVACTENSDGDLTAIGDEDFSEAGFSHRASVLSV